MSSFTFPSTSKKLQFNHSVFSMVTAVTTKQQQHQQQQQQQQTKI
jgi:hypothetical protein